MRDPTMLSLALLALALLPVVRAWAQTVGDRPVLNVDGNRDYATQSRYDFSDEEAGLRAGPLDVSPAAAQTFAYDSNVLAAPGPRAESALSVSQALLHVTGEPGGIYRYDSQAYVRARRFTDASDQDTTEYGGSVSLGAGLSSRDDLSGDLTAQRRFEPRTDIETPDIREVSLYDAYTGNLTYAHTYNRLQTRYILMAQQLDYQEGDQKYRDRSSYEGQLTAGYDVAQDVSLIGAGYFREDDYRFSSPLIAGARTIGGLIGTHMSIPEIADFRFTAGYFRRDFDRHLGEITGVAVDASVVYYLTRLTTVRADLTREDYPTRIAGAYGKVRTDGLLEIGHAYSRNLNLYARLRVVIDDFQTVQRTDETWLGEIGAFHELSRGWVLGAEYDISERSSPVRGADFLQHVISVSLIGRL